MYAKKSLKTIMIEYCNIKDHCHYTGKYRGAPYNIYNLIPKETPIVFYNGLKYDYHFTAIILLFKALADKFNEEFERLGKNTDKYVTSSVPVKKLNQKQ